MKICILNYPLHTAVFNHGKNRLHCYRFAVISFQETNYSFRFLNSSQLLANSLTTPTRG